MRPIDFLVPDFRRDPWPVYARLRRTDPVWWSEEIRMWCVFRHAEIKTCLTSPAYTVEYPFRTSRDAFGETLLDLDGPEHTRLRPHLAALLHGQEGNLGFAEVAEREIEALLSSLRGRDELEFMADIATPLPQRVSTAFIGLPLADSDWVGERVRYLAEHLDGSRGDFSRVAEHRREIWGYLREQLHAAGPEPTALAVLRGHVEAGRLSEKEALGLLSLTLAAGIETSVATLGNTMSCFVQHPEWIERVRHDDEACKRFVREAARWEPAQHDTVRVAARDTELGGHALRKGTPLKLLLASANRDESIFEDGERFDPMRPRRPLLSFGLGAHACLGQQITSRQTHALFGALLREFPALHGDRLQASPIEGSTFRRPASIVLRLHATSEPSEPSAPAHVELRRKLEPLWVAALELDGEVPPQASFFELGGYSLLAVALAEQVGQALGAEVSGTLLFEHPTLDGVVAHLLATSPAIASPAEPTSSATTEEPEDPHEPFPLSDLQQAYWLGEDGSFTLHSPAYFFEAYETPQLDVPRFIAAVQALAARQGMLRGRFLADGTQAVGRDDSAIVHVHELRGHPRAEAERRIEQHRAELERLLPPLASGPPLRIDVLVGDDAFHVLVLGRLLVFDGLSGYIFADELRALYEGESLGALRHDYRDYRRAFAAMERSEAYARSWHYWEQRADGLPGAPELPQRRDPPPATMRRRTLQLDPARWEALQARCREHGVTPSMALCTAFCEVLARWSRSLHFTLNLMYGQRLALVPEVERIIGNFSSTLLLEYDGRAPAAFYERVQALQRRFGQDLEHGAVSGVAVLRELNRRWGTRAGASMPVVFASMLGASRQGDDRLFLERLGWRRRGGAVQTPQVSFDHQVFETATGLVLHWDTRDALYPAGVLDAMFEAYRERLERLAQDGREWREPAIEALPAAQLAVRRQVNETHASVPRRALHAGFVAQARQHPERAAVITATATVSYGELLAAALGVAQALLDAGHAPRQPVAILAPKGWMQLAAMLGVLCAGGVYVPLSPEAPPSRLRRIAARAGFAQLLCAHELRAAATWWEDPTLVIETASETASEGSSAVLTRLATSLEHHEELAYVIYTSGTTGEPKGVMIPHAGAVNTIDDVNRRFHVGPDDRVLAVSEYTFDLSVYDVFGVLEVGGAVVLPRAEHARDPEHLHALARAHGVTLWNTVPAYFALLAEYALDRAEAALPELRLVLLSGDWIPLELPARVQQLAPRARCISLGGATEASIWSNLFEIPAVLPAAWVSVPYGHPLRNQQFRVLDSRLRDRPDWVAGELYILGRGLASGYQGDAAATDAAFVVDPCTGERMYRTGDWARYWPDGTLEFLGRQDAQVKLGGFRVELGEIERCLADHPAVDSVAAIVRGAPGRYTLTVFVEALPEDPSALIVELRQRVAEHLPPYMSPRSIVVLRSLPLTHNGKIDRKALAARDDGPEPRKGPARSATAREARLLEIWTAVLGRDDIGLDDEFFALGGSSLTAARLVNAIERAWGVRLPLATLFQQPTARALAEALEQALAHAPKARGSHAIWLTPPQAPHTVTLVHPIGGDVLCYRPLVAALGSAVAVLGLQAHGEAAPLRSIHAMAESYVARLPEHQPSLLVGWSFGGLVAYEIGRRLLRERGHAPLVVMIDPWVPPANLSQAAADPRRIIRSFLHDLTTGRHEPAPLPSGSPRERLLREAWQAACAHDPALAAASFEDITRLYAIYAAHDEALLGYRFAPAPGLAALLLECEDLGSPTLHRHLEPLRQHLGTLPSTMAWERVPGDHYTALVGDHAASLGARLRRLLGAPTTQPSPLLQDGKLDHG